MSIQGSQRGKHSKNQFLEAGARRFPGGGKTHASLFLTVSVMNSWWMLPKEQCFFIGVLLMYSSPR